MSMTPGGQEWNKLPQLCKAVLFPPFTWAGEWTVVLFLTSLHCGLGFLGVLWKAHGPDSGYQFAFLPVLWAGLHPILLPPPPKNPKLLQNLAVASPATHSSPLGYSSELFSVPCPFSA